MATLPRFGAESSLGGFKYRGAGTTAADIAGEIVYPAQLRVDALEEWLKRPDLRYVVNDCPPGQRATSVCAWWLPIYECRFTGGGNYECYIKKWDCQSYKWECQQRMFQALK